MICHSAAELVCRKHIPRHSDPGHASFNFDFGACQEYGRIADRFYAEIRSTILLFMRLVLSGIINRCNNHVIRFTTNSIPESVSGQCDSLHTSYPARPVAQGSAA